jgi:hypothetical protein
MPKRLPQNESCLQLQLLAAVLLFNAVSALAQNQFIANDDDFTAAASTLIFSDNFNNGSLNANKWRMGANAGNKSAVVNFALDLRSQGAESGWIITKNAYKARNTTVKIKVVQPNDDGALGISPTYKLASQTGIADQKNGYRFYVYRSGHTGWYRLYVKWRKNGVENGRDVTGDLVIKGAVYLRLRCDPTHIYFEASLNGSTWTGVYAEAFALPGYTPDSTFYYELSGYNTGANGVLTVDDFLIAPSVRPPDTQPPQITRVAATSITPNSAKIKWQTSEPADSQVEYGLTINYGNTASLDPALVASHLVKLTGLQSNKTYHYRVKSKDAAGHLAVSGDFVFTTPVAPAVTVTSPNGGEWWLADENRAIKWTALSSIAKVRLEFSEDGGGSWRTIVDSTPNDGAYAWRVPGVISSATLIRISSAANPSAADVSNKPFFITRNTFVKFSPVTSNPVLSPGPPGSWDERITERGWFMYENGMYHAWYGGWKGSYDHGVKNFVKLGYAYSTDGIHWKKHAGNPIYTQHWTEDMSVVDNDGTYYMFAENEYHGDGDGATIDLYTSTDKVHWTRYGVVLSPGSKNWESTSVGTATVWKEGGNWYMLYEGFGSGLAGQVGLATSSDGKNWSRSPQNPVLTHARGNQFDIAIDSITRINDVYYAFGHYDTGGSVWAGGVFISTNPVGWIAYPGNPVLDNSAVIVENGGNYFMYGISSNPDALAPYYLKSAAFSDFNVKAAPVTSVAAPLPLQFALQNYPNPFNAVTRIHLALPQETELRLSIFDLTGREVHELLTGTRAAGNYEIIWNGKNQRDLELGTGIYLLRLRYRTEGNGAWSQMVRRVMMVK